MVLLAARGTAASYETIRQWCKKIRCDGFKNDKKYHVNKIYPRHYIETAKQVGFETEKLKNILSKSKTSTEQTIIDIQAKLPVNFPKNISESIFSGMLK